MPLAATSSNSGSDLIGSAHSSNNNSKQQDFFTTTTLSNSLSRSNSALFNSSCATGISRTSACFSESQSAVASPVSNMSKSGGSNGSMMDALMGNDAAMSMEQIQQLLRISLNNNNKGSNSNGRKMNGSGSGASLNGSSNGNSGLSQAAEQMAALAAAAQQIMAAAQQFAVVTASSQPAGGKQQQTVKKSQQQKTKNITMAKIKRENCESENGFGDAAVGSATSDFWTQLMTQQQENTNGAIDASGKPLNDKNDDTAAASTVMLLPKESETAERKRPAAIQELLQMKRARLTHTTNNGGGDVTQQQRGSVSPSDAQPPTLISSLNDGNTEILDYSDFERYGSDDGSAPTAVDDDNIMSSADADGAGAPLSEILHRLCSGNADDDAETQATSTTCSSVTDAVTAASQQQQQHQQNQRAFAELMANFGNSAGYANAESLLKAAGYATPSKSPKPEAASPSASSALSPRLPSRTNDNDVCESPLASLVPHDRIFAQVPGRLSLLSNVVKYKMTVGEVKRRLMGPESFNFSLLGALLRRAKMPEKSQMLVEELSQVGLSIPRGRRRMSQVTLLSALTESESHQLVKDFRRISEQEFPAEMLAAHAARGAVSVGGGADVSAAVMTHVQRTRRRAELLEAAMTLTDEFMRLLADDRSPVMDSNPEPVYDRNLQDPLSTFSMLTHGFGTPAILVGVQIFHTFLRHQMTALCQQQPPPM